MREAVGIGETIELAQKNACINLGIDESEATFEVIQLPEKRKFGLFGGRQAKVIAKSNDDPAKATYNYLTTIVSNLSENKVQVDMKNDDKGVIFDLSGNGLKDIIGKRGEILESLQILSGLVACQNSNSYYKVVVNAGNYKNTRQLFVEKLARDKVNEFFKKHKNIHLKPMNSYERRIVHEMIHKVEGVSSWSEDEGLNRHVVIGNK